MFISGKYHFHYIHFVCFEQLLYLFWAGGLCNVLRDMMKESDGVVCVPSVWAKYRKGGGHSLTGVT